MVNLVDMIARSLVDDPDKVRTTLTDEGREQVIVLSVAADDMGKVIGKQGRIAKAIRTVVQAAAGKAHRRVNVEILSEEELREAGLLAAGGSSEEDGSEADALAGNIFGGDENPSDIADGANDASATEEASPGAEDTESL